MVGREAGRPTFHLETVNVDCADAQAMAAFYGRLLGWDVTWQDAGYVLMLNPEGGVGLSFQELEDYRAPTWPEQPDAQDKMIHLDVRVEDLAGAVEYAIAAGGRLAPYQGREDLRVILDPAGHPLCLFLE
jgi:catechol 2,3-dioxygenase-like lactoylglutathione lyase family enzyme